MTYPVGAPPAHDIPEATNVWECTVALELLRSDGQLLLVRWSDHCPELVYRKAIIFVSGYSSRA